MALYSLWLPRLVYMADSMCELKRRHSGPANIMFPCGWDGGVDETMCVRSGKGIILDLMLSSGAIDGLLSSGMFLYV